MLQNFPQNACGLTLWLFISCLQVVAFVTFCDHQTAVAALHALNVRMRVLDRIYRFLSVRVTPYLHLSKVSWSSVDIYR